MKKKLLLGISLAALSAGAMMGCVQNDGKVHISFWHTMGQTNQAWLNERITEFNKIYPDVVIEHTAQGGYDDLKSKISKAIPAGTTPTMAYCYPDHVADYLVAGAVEELTPYIDNEAYGFGKKEAEDKDLGDLGKDDYISGYWSEGTNYVNKDGSAAPGVYSLPFSKSTEVMFYNKTAFDANGWSVPKTWNELWSWAAIAKKTYDDKDISLTPIGYDSDANLLITLFEQYQIPYTSAETNAETGHFLFNNDRAKSLVKDLVGYFNEKLFVTQGTSSSNTYTSNLFIKGAAKGGCLITIGSTGGTGYNFPTSSETEKGGSFEVGVAEIPQADESNKKVIMQGPSMCFFKRASEEQKKYAWLFYKYLTNTDNSASYSYLTGYQPVRESSYESEYYDQYDESLDAGTKYELIHQVTEFIPTIKDHYFTSPAFEGSTAARAEMEGLLAAVCNNGTPVETAFEDALTNCIFSQNS